MKLGLRLRYVVEDVDRHGNVRLYFRRRGQRKLRLPGSPGSPEFFAAYQAAMAGLPKHYRAERNKIVEGSLRALTVEYFKSAQFTRLAPNTRASAGASWSASASTRIAKGSRTATCLTVC